MSVTNAQLHRDIGRVESTVNSHAGRLDKVDEKLDTIREDLSKILQHVEHEKGRRRGFVAAVSIAGSLLGAAAGAVVQFFGKH